MGIQQSVCADRSGRDQSQSGTDRQIRRRKSRLSSQGLIPTLPIPVSTLTWTNAFLPTRRAADSSCAHLWAGGYPVVMSPTARGSSDCLRRVWIWCGRGSSCTDSVLPKRWRDRIHFNMDKCFFTHAPRRRLQLCQSILSKHRHPHVPADQFLICVKIKG